MKRIAGILALLCVFSALLSCFTASASDGSAGVDEYEEYLISLGFPRDYATKLSVLHSLHPSWTFVPLMVSELNPKYTWEYVVKMEAEDEPGRSLVRTSQTYSAYHHPENKTLFDNGWYQASREAVEYFLDPRNFLNEKDIFQFENLMVSEGASYTTEQVEAALAGTFMAGAYLENGRTYAEYFIEVGREFEISPLHLAARARQEQNKDGGGSSVEGRCGDLLWYYYSNGVQYEAGRYINSPSGGYDEQTLKSYNGLYNLLNIGASGDGQFPLLISSMKRAKTGTAAMADEWGDGGEWNTRWKSIYGGAYYLYTQYISNYQNTIYLQKWNVDARSVNAAGKSRNFWGQYMQHIGGALGEGQTAFISYARSGSLDLPFTFLIPVYSEMPTSCPDPAAGYCGVYAVSSAKFSYINSLISPSASGSTKNNMIKAAPVAVTAGENILISGHSVHTYGLEGYEYSIDHGEWHGLDAYFSTSAAEAYPTYANCTSPGSINAFTGTIPTAGLAAGRHIVSIRGKAGFGAAAEYVDGVYYLIAEIEVEVKEGRPLSVVINSPDGTVMSEMKYPQGSEYVLPETSEPDDRLIFVGWLALSFNQARFYASGTKIKLTENITLTPVFVDLKILDGAAAKISETSSLRYTSEISYSAVEWLLDISETTGAVFSVGHIICETAALTTGTLDPAVLSEKGIPYIKSEGELKAGQGAAVDDSWRFSADTPDIKAASYDKAYSASGFIRVIYSDGEQRMFITDYNEGLNSRSVRSVAASALADTSYTYPDNAKQILQMLAGQKQ